MITNMLKAKFAELDTVVSDEIAGNVLVNESEETDNTESDTKATSVPPSVVSNSTGLATEHVLVAKSENDSFENLEPKKVTFEGIQDKPPIHTPGVAEPSKKCLKKQYEWNDSGYTMVSSIGKDGMIFSPKPCFGENKLSGRRVEKCYRRGGKLLLDIVFNGTPVQAQWDQGAEATIISNAFYESLQNKPKCDINIGLAGFEKDATVRKGKFCENATFEFGNYTYGFPPCVGPSEVPVLIGADFLFTFGIDLKITECCLDINGDKIPLEYTGDSNSKDFDDIRVSRVQLISNITVKPRTGRTIYVEPRVDNPGLMLFEPRLFNDIGIETSVVLPNGKIPVTFLNFNDEKVQLKKGLSIGLITDCNELTIDVPSESKTSLDPDGPNVTDSPADTVLADVPENALGSIRLESRQTPGKSVFITTDIGRTYAAAPDPGGTIPTLTAKVCRVESPPMDRKADEDGPPEYEIPLHLTNSYEKYSEVFPATNAVEFDNLKNELPEHIQDMFQRSCNKISFRQATRFADTLVFFVDIFSKGGWDLGLCTITEHCISTGSARPIAQQMRRTPAHFEKEEYELLQDMLRAGVIQPSNSAWASPVTLVRKKNGGLRWTIDLRKLNDVTVKDRFPLPRIDQCLDTLAGQEYYCSLDAANGYWQIPLEETSRAKTSFICKYGSFEHLRLAQGLCNAPATYQRTMQQIMRGLLYVSVIIFIDDAITFGKTFKETLYNVEKVLSRFKFYNLKLKPGKCNFFQTEVVFLGRKVSKDGVSITESHIEAVKEWPMPSTIGDLEKWVGFCNYHRKHVKNFALMSDCLYKRIASSKGEVPPGRGRKAYQRIRANLNDMEIEAFERLRTAIIEAPILPFPDCDKYFLVDSDSSGSHIGGELSQLVDGQLEVVAYASRILTPPQTRYCPTKRELLAATALLREWRHYLIGKRFLLRVDNAALTFLLSFKNLDAHMQRWITELQNFDFVLVHRHGKEHENADFFTRPPVTNQECSFFRPEVELTDLPCASTGPDGGKIACVKCEAITKKWSDFHMNVDDTLPLAGIISAISLDFSHINPAEVDVSIAVQGFTTQELREAQEADYEFGTIIDWLKSNSEPSSFEFSLSSPAVRHYWSVRNQFVFISDVLYFRWEDMMDSRLLLCVPYSMRDDVMFYQHDSLLAGHPGIEATYANVVRSYYWRNRYADCAIYVNLCPTCNVCKKPNRKRKAKQALHHSGFPSQRVHCDILGPLSITKNKNKVVLMIIDQFTKFLEAIPLPDQKGCTIAKAFVNEWCVRYGTCLELHSDNGKNFIEGIFKEVTTRLQIMRTSCIIYRPCGNGQCERQNRFLMSKIRSLILSKRHFREWDDYVPFAAGAMRASINRTTGFTPNFLMFGRELPMPSDIVYNHSSMSEEIPVTDYVKSLIDLMREAYQDVRKHVQVTQLRQKRDFDRLSYDPEINIGDVVYARDSPKQKKRISAKLLPVFKGPFLVVDQINPVVYILQGRKNVYAEHYDRVIPATKGEVLPGWITTLRNQLLNPPENQPLMDHSNRLGDPIGDIGTLFDPTGHTNRLGDPIGDVRALFDQTDQTDLDVSTLHNFDAKGQRVILGSEEDTVHDVSITLPDLENSISGSQNSHEIDVIPVNEHISNEDGSHLGLQTTQMETSNITPAIVEDNVNGSITVPVIDAEHLNQLIVPVNNTNPPLRSRRSRVIKPTYDSENFDLS